MKKRMKSKAKKNKGLSPVIATVLLITIVIVIALIVFLWVRGMTEEAITKFDDKVNIKLVCEDVSFEASYTAGTGLYITNPGSVPIFDMDIKVVGEGNHETISLLGNGYGWPTTGLNQGGVFSNETIAFDGTEIVLIPVLIGESESGRKTYVCDEAQYGYRLLV
jgi:flagellin-like protein